jgi:hypothetical protein
VVQVLEHKPALQARSLSSNPHPTKKQRIRRKKIGYSHQGEGRQCPEVGGPWGYPEVKFWALMRLFQVTEIQVDLGRLILEAKNSKADPASSSRQQENPGLLC